MDSDLSCTGCSEFCQVYGGYLCIGKNRRRLTDLRVFKALGALYFKNVTLDDFSLEPIESQKSRSVRRAMNRMLESVAQSFDLLGLPRLMSNAFVGDVDILANLFQLWRFRIEPAEACDMLDRAIGEYERQTRRSFRQLFNPFFWLLQLLSLPFRFLTAVGFDGAMMERSPIGKSLKAVAGVAAFSFAVGDHWEKITGVSAHAIQMIHKLI